MELPDLFHYELHSVCVNVNKYRLNVNKYGLELNEFNLLGVLILYTTVTPVCKI